jgi:hypothetical protein
MPVVVVVHRLKNFDEWLKVFKADPPPQIGRWRLLRGSDDRNRVHVVGEVKASEVKAERVDGAARIHLARRASTLVSQRHESNCRQAMSAFGGKADMTRTQCDVR